MEKNLEQDILQRVRENISKVLFIKPEKIQPANKFIDDLGADSMDRTSIMLCLEEEFGKKIDDKIISNIETVQDAISIIQDNLGKKEKSI